MKACLNPSCKKKFTPGHYGDLQKVCGGSYVEKCRRCPGKLCRRCKGLGKRDRTCKEWYREYYAATLHPPRAIPDMEFSKISSAAKKDNIRRWAMLLVAHSSGLRKGELLGLSWSDLTKGDIPRSVITVRGQWDDRRGFIPMKVGKGKTAVIPSKDARDAVATARRVAKSEKPTDRAFPYWETGVWAWFTDLQDSLGITNPDTGRAYPWHSLRHTAAIRTLLATGGDLKAAADLLGHKSLNTTRIYTQERPEDLVARLELAMRRKG
jgi:integrase/recombinase XerD